MHTTHKISINIKINEMKKLIPLMTFCGLFAGTSIAQVNPAMAPDTPIWGAIENTGIAIAPQYQWQAVVYDDPAGVYYIQWLDAATGALLHMDKQEGANPDVAYNANAQSCAVAYENSGGIFVDDYYTTPPSPFYSLNMNNGVAGGINPNIDINSLGQGVLTWENGGGVFMCSFTMFPFTPGPTTFIASGSMPDVALMDNGQDIVLTNVQGGQLIMRTYDFPSLTGGSAVPSSPPIVALTLGLGFEWPRVQSNRNSLFGGAPELYTVVAQDRMFTGTCDVQAYFYSAPGVMAGNVLVNNGVNTCLPSNPRPVVAYDRDEVHVAWAQDYICSFVPPITTPDLDVLMVQFDYSGGYATGFGPLMFQEVNSTVANFTFSATSLNTEYDGNFLITPGNYCEGIVFNDPGKLFWKKRDAFLPFFKTGAASNYAVSIVKGIDSDVIEVEIESTIDSEVALSDVNMEFVLYDAMGRVIDVPTVTESGTSYYIDASQLGNGIYLLHYEINGIAQATRIPHFKN
jgi:hypothetical protein